MSFTVAIVGRPNVGKSTLFNRLAGRRLALVDDTPGVTRDRREATAHLGDLTFTIIDTAGLEEAASESLPGRMRAQTEAAVAAADAVFFVIDARAGVMPADRAFVNMLRRAAKPTILLANKSEGRAGAAGSLEGFDLGLGEPVAVSAEHGEGLGDLYDALREALPDQTALPDHADRADGDEGEAAAVAEPERPIRIAVVGRPNAGKSTLINRLIGEERLLTGPEAGITRDAIAVPLAWQGRRLLVHDTAGMRRGAPRSRQARKALRRRCAGSDPLRRGGDPADGRVRRVREQDMRIADLVEREGRALVIGVNKWDLKEGDAGGGAGKLRGEADHLLAQLKGVPIVAVSGLTGAGLERLMQAVLDIHAAVEQAGRDQSDSTAGSKRRSPRIRRPRCPGAGSSSITSPRPSRGRRPSCCSAPAPMRCPRPIAAISSTACASRSTCPACRSG